MFLKMVCNADDLNKTSLPRAWILTVSLRTSISMLIRRSTNHEDGGVGNLDNIYVRNCATGTEEFVSSTVASKGPEAVPLHLILQDFPLSSFCFLCTPRTFLPSYSSSDRRVLSYSLFSSRANLFHLLRQVVQSLIENCVQALVLP